MATDIHDTIMSVRHWRGSKHIRVLSHLHCSLSLSPQWKAGTVSLDIIYQRAVTCGTHAWRRRVGVGVRPARGPHGRAVIDGRGGGPVGWLVVGRGHVLACSLGGSGGFGRLHLLPCSVGWGRRD